MTIAAFSHTRLGHLKSLYHRFNLLHITIPYIALPHVALSQVSFPPVVLNQANVQQRDLLHFDPKPLVQGSLETGTNVLLWSLYFFKLLWSICKQPLILSVATALTPMVFLNIYATVYTVTHDSFLDHFCQQKAPILRGWLCTSWDLLQEQRNSNAPEQPNLNQAFEHYLHSQTEEKTPSWAFPHWLARCESGVRQFRASLPQSEFSP